MSNFENRRNISPAMWEKCNQRTSSRWQRFWKAFQAFDQKVEDFCYFYWLSMILAIVVAALLWLGVEITLQPQGWYHIGHSLGETFLGW